MGKVKVKLGAPLEYDEEIAPILTVNDEELPQEFKQFDKILGLDTHIFNIINIGIITNLCVIYFWLYLIPFRVISTWILFPVIAYGYLGGLGVTVGCHRYWTHRTFKANLKLQWILMLMYSATFHLPIFKWCRYHRVHHKHTDTNSDPHSSARGFWFSHITWHFHPRHPDFDRSLKEIDISDLAQDPIVRFHSRHYWKLTLLIAFVIPMGIVHQLFPQLTILQLLIINYARLGSSFHCTSLVNSVAHMWGDKPYDKSITATDNKLVALLSAGEGWHNYHHTFPWDYKASEFGYKFNLSTPFIEFFAWIGWAWQLKTVSKSHLISRINRTGSNSGSYEKLSKDKDDDNHEMVLPSWGWGDKELKKEDVEITTIIY